MRRRELHVVLGAGIAGSLAAITRSRAGYEVILLEKEEARAPGTYPLCTQTSNIVSESHSGAEYPFDPQSARDCLDGRIENERFFPEIAFGGKTYSRILASRSMVDAGYDIVGQCHANMEVIRSHYQQRCTEDPANEIFGDPADVCSETEPVDSVEDVAATFLTPQRGINPVLVSTILEWELMACGVNFRQGATVGEVSNRPDGCYEVGYRTAAGVTESLVADQVSICTATSAFATAKRLNPEFGFPPIYMALRSIFYVDLPDGVEKNFTCLKLEDAFGGMFSPLTSGCAMIYHPPAAHMKNVAMNPDACELPREYRHYLAAGHPELAERAEHTIARLREFYPELERSQILGSYLKVAINTVPDSRVRRNLGVFDIRSGATMTALAKWTMCAVSSKTELELALRHSVSRGNLDAADATTVVEEATRQCWETAPPWGSSWESLIAQARKHATNMNVPEVVAGRFDDGRPSPLAAAQMGAE